MIPFDVRTDLVHRVPGCPSSDTIDPSEVGLKWNLSKAEIFESINFKEAYFRYGITPNRRSNRSKA